MYKRPTAIEDLPGSVPVFPLSGALLLPFSHRPLNIFEPRYRAMVDDALKGDRLIGLIQPCDTSIESPHGKVPLERIGCLGRLTHFEETDEDRYLIVLQGICRFELVSELSAMTPYRQGRISVSRFARDFDHGHGADAVDRTRFIRMMHDYAEYANFDMNWSEVEATSTADLVNFCCMVSPYGPAEKQVLLEADSLQQRAETLIAMVEVEMARSGTGAPLQ